MSEPLSIHEAWRPTLDEFSRLLQLAIGREDIHISRHHFSQWSFARTGARVATLCEREGAFYITRVHRDPKTVEWATKGDVLSLLGLLDVWPSDEGGARVSDAMNERTEHPATVFAGWEVDARRVAIAKAQEKADATGGPVRACVVPMIDGVAGTPVAVGWGLPQDRRWMIMVHPDGTESVVPVAPYELGDSVER